MFIMNNGPSTINSQLLPENETLFSNTYSLINHPEYLARDKVRDDMTDSFSGRDPYAKSYTKTRKVFFSVVEERQYGTCLGDSPSCKYGPPISLSWARTKGCTFSIAEYERMRRRRRRSQLIIPAERREELLLNMGYTLTQLIAVISEIKDRKVDNKKHMDELRAV